MKLYRIILPVTNIEEAARFYSEILGMPGKRVSPGRHYFNLGGTILACYDPVTDGDEAGRQWVFHENQYIYIAVSDLEAIHKKMANSTARHVDPTIELMPWGERLFYVIDPFGNPICFVDERTIFTGD